MGVKREVRVQLVCDVIDCHFESSVYFKKNEDPTDTKVRRQMKELGWVRKRIPIDDEGEDSQLQDICPNCKWIFED